MKIHYSNTSPYARKVRVFAALAPNLPIEWVLTRPFESQQLRSINPLGKIPVLESPSITLFDSSLICEYLDDYLVQRGEASRFAKGTDRYFEVQKTHWLANGVLDAAVDWMMESRRSDSEISDYWQSRRMASIEAGLSALSPEDFYLGTRLHIGGVAAACALGYLAFRLPQVAVSDINASLAQWYGDLAPAPWFAASQPHD